MGDDVQLKETAMTALEALCGIPSAPYYEARGARWVMEFCEKAGLEVGTDAYGNVLVTRPGSDPTMAGIAFVAHLDHPGFEALRQEGDQVVGELRGGLNDAACSPGTRVQFITGKGNRFPGEITDSSGTGRKRTLKFRVEAAAMRELPCGVVLDLVDFELDEKTIRARALDDLAGCAAIATLLATTHDARGSVYGLFTRAEEVGLEGARLAASERLIPEGTTIVSVESSKALPGAEIGGGPVIRVGDYLATFDRDAEAHLATAATELKSEDPEFRFQRQLMSGGVCEASAFAAYGYAVTGLAFPLGNYHNNAPDGQVAAEYIHARDYLDGVRLLAAAAKRSGTRPRPAVVARFATPPEGHQRLRQ